MSVKEELHDLVDQLAEERALEALTYLQSLLAKNGSLVDSEPKDLEDRMKRTVIAGRDFFAQKQRGLESLAAQQGVGPITDFDELLGDFWPEDESVDEFIAAVRDWRSDGDYA